MKQLLLLMTVLCVSASIYAQQATEKKKGHIELEVDPIAYFLKGYSFHAGYQLNRIRYDVGVFGLETPEAFTSNDDYLEKSNGVGIKADYLLGKKAGGFFVGLEADYTWTKVSIKKSTVPSQTGEAFAAGIRGGYRIMFGRSANAQKGFYLTPWIGIDRIFHTKNVHFPAQGTRAKYKQEDWRFFPTIHLGWRF
ncbi:autotransporter outer membrane beta-barrel domain-containing protein [Pseudoflavitalea sp. G-6-1-2]|uniref:autotransporter outer membrane beta-barrel domain-containing protein n=1 Tax=Pseudoflavitalea sp. G-6-1-2 TaxID=2728841 RepID=UPI00146ACFB7|nr:autotransporter outer membrane beta-barrel domain-containing protein [Pseudoflavitalea sp. G-6-1-2]NML21252.1 autotransporter outer membrane beta-barrel domain-containing protein [Pseudoflavitalea sp. G-6-1-2]